MIIDHYDANKWASKYYTWQCLVVLNLEVSKNWNAIFSKWRKSLKLRACFLEIVDLQSMFSWFIAPDNQII